MTAMTARERTDAEYAEKLAEILETMRTRDIAGTALGYDEADALYVIRELRARNLIIVPRIQVSNHVLVLRARALDKRRPESERAQAKELADRIRDMHLGPSPE